MNQSKSYMKVRKCNGDLVPFEENKLREALLKSGGQKYEINKIITEVLEYMYDGISTKKIYQIAYRILRKKSKSAAGRYKLKKALFDMGPSGYTFEKLLGRLFQNKGYEVKVGEIVQGCCVTHEVDVVAEKDNEIVMVECKFHQQQGRKSDVKVALYIKSRFDDIKAAFEKEGKLKNKQFKGYVVTNTRFTDDAIQYGRCAGLHLLSWNYPHHKTLQNWIEEADFHPVTALSSITKRVQLLLLEENIILCQDIIYQKSKLLEKGIPQNVVKKIIQEAEDILGKKVK